MHSPEALFPLLTRAAQRLGAGGCPRLPSALDFTLFLAEREALFVRLDKRLVVAEAKVDADLNRRRFHRFWVGEYKSLLDATFVASIDRLLNVPTEPYESFWTDLWDKTEAEIRQISGNAADDLTQSWALNAFWLCKNASDPSERANQLRIENHAALGSFPLSSKERAEAHAANLERNDPLGYGVRLWIRRQQRETKALLWSLELLDGGNGVICARLSDGNRPTYEALVSAYVEGGTPPCRPVPETEAFWERRVGPFREAIEQPGRTT